MEKSKIMINEKTANELMKAFEEHKKSATEFLQITKEIVEDVVFKYRKN